MNKSKIYSEMLDKLGWFDAGLFEPLEFVDFAYPKFSLSETDTIGYFPGCFAEFHEGHIETIQNFVKHTPFSKVIVAPANSDYTFSKYGNVEQATNKYRFNKILSFSDRLDSICGKDNWTVDLNPMLNFERDSNFTDLLEHFLNRHQMSIDSMQIIPYIICGKDRDYRDIEKLSNKIKIFYNEDGTGCSSSSIMKIDPKPRIKKNLILRCKNKEEFNIFCNYWYDQYENIEPLYLEDELNLAKSIVDSGIVDSTNCREYKHLLPYIHISRRWNNPLLQEEHWTDGNILGRSLLDSDIYTGSTQKFVESKGGKLRSVLDLSKKTNNVELLDFDDFRRMEFKYPFVDISSRCSMQAFHQEMHTKYKIFRIEIGAEE